MNILFKAKNKQDEVALQCAVLACIKYLRYGDFTDVTGDRLLHFINPYADVIAYLFEIGFAPEKSNLGNLIRRSVRTIGQARIMISSDHAEELSKILEIGLVRHQMGCNNPKTFVLH